MANYRHLAAWSCSKEEVTSRLAIEAVGRRHLSLTCGKEWRLIRCL
uniref:Uncharacterized protein n=1 Tax=Rhizophora mucronata TaxID=61149 RepID=A0A2P2N0U4_RHIMU